MGENHAIKYNVLVVGTAADLVKLDGGEYLLVSKDRKRCSASLHHTEVDKILAAGDVDHADLDDSFAGET